MDFQASETHPARLIAVSNRMNLKAATSEATFTAELERIVNLAVPHLASDRPNLVALGEALGLPLTLAGKRGSLPRRMHSASVAISMLALSYARRILYYRRVFPGISPARALLLSLSDVLYRPFTETLSQLAARHHIYLSASTITPHVHRATESGKVSRFGKKQLGCAYLPVDPGVYKTGFLWGPDGSLIGTTDKVFLSASECTMLDIAPGTLDEVHPFETELGRVGIAISLDAFTPEYLRRLDDQGTQIIVQSGANDGAWTAPSAPCAWQPQQWLNSVLGSLQDEYPHVLFNVCAMQVGNFFDMTFDGQSTITMKGPCEPDPRCNFVGNDGFSHTVTGKPFKGCILALAPWATHDPILNDAHLSLAERRALLTSFGKQLRPGGTRANQYPEAAIWADIEVPL